MSDGGRRSATCASWAFTIRLLTEDLRFVPLARVAKLFDFDKNVPDLEREALMEAFELANCCLRCRDSVQQVFNEKFVSVGEVLANSIPLFCTAI